MVRPPRARSLDRSEGKHGLGHQPAELGAEGSNPSGPAITKVPNTLPFLSTYACLVSDGSARRPTCLMAPGTSRSSSSRRPGAHRWRFGLLEDREIAGRVEARSSLRGQALRRKPWGALPAMRGEKKTDHVDGDPANRSPANLLLRLLCRECNVAEGDEGPNAFQLKRKSGKGTCASR